MLKAVEGYICEPLNKRIFQLYGAEVGGDRGHNNFVTVLKINCGNTSRFMVS